MPRVGHRAIFEAAAGAGERQAKGGGDEAEAAGAVAQGRGGRAGLDWGEVNLFAEAAQTDLGPPAAGESKFSYLNRSARIEASNVRMKLEEWLSRYPDDHQANLAARLRSNDDGLFSSATFELILHELVVRNGHQIVAIEPSIPESRFRPDFLIQSKAGDRFYLEAANAVGESPALQAAKKRKAAAMEIIYGVRCPWHFLDVYAQGLPARPPKLRVLRQRLDAWTQSLEKGETDAAPFIWSEDDFEVTIKPRNRNKEQGPDEHTSVALEMGEGQSGTLGDGVREVLKKKASRYGALPHPLIVAVNDLTFFAGLDELWAALLGSPCVIFRSYADGRVEPLDEEGRRPNGVLLDSKGPRRTGLSAVMYFENLSAWSVGQRRGVIAHNPYAVRPLPYGLFGIDEFSPVEGELVKTEGRALSKCLDLPADWPR
jgi:hypothetical protein